MIINIVRAICLSVALSFVFLTVNQVMIVSDNPNFLNSLQLMLNAFSVYMWLSALTRVEILEE